MIGVHDFHVWQLVDGMVIASIHVKVQDGCDFGEIAGKIKKVFHRQGIHSTAIQPEFAAHPMGVSIEIVEILLNCLLIGFHDSNLACRVL